MKSPPPPRPYSCPSVVLVQGKALLLLDAAAVLKLGDTHTQSDCAFHQRSCLEVLDRGCSIRHLVTLCETALPHIHTDCVVIMLHVRFVLDHPVTLPTVA